MEIDFRPWFISHGGTIHPDVEIASGSIGNYLRLRDDCSLSPGTMIVSCPHSLTISWLNVITRQDPFIDRFYLSPVRDGSTVITKFVLVRLFLVEQYLLGERSFWWPYIRFLPQPFTKDGLNSSLWYNEDDLLWLRGTNMEDAMRRVERNRRIEYDEAIGALTDAAVHFKEVWSWDLYNWAAIIMDSRCFPASSLANNVHNGGYSDDPANGAPPEADRDSPVMLPGMDLANHRPTANVTWLYNREDCGLVLDDRYDGGQPIWNNYGPKPNEQLVMGYGFSIFRNPADRCNLAVSSEISSRSGPSIGWSAMSKGASTGPWDKAASAIPSLTEQTLDERIQWVQLVDENKDDGDGDNQTSYEFSPPFLEELSGALSNEREILVPDLSLRSKVDFTGDVVTRNTLNVMCAVVMKLQRQSVAISSHNDSLPQWPLNEKQFHAARYRRSQLRILKSVIGCLLGNLRTLVGLNPPKERNLQLVRLEHILLESPKEFLTQLRACLNAGLGTRKATKIREKQWVECAFTLWMCGLWLWDLSGLQRCDADSGSDFDARISQWLHWVRRTYGDSPETDNLVTLHRKRKSSSPRRFGDSGPDSWNINDGIVDLGVANEDFLIAESYLRVANAAVKKNKNSIYNHPQVTTRRLFWCMNIIRQEGFMCPNLEGDTGEEHDEFVLFLEVGRGP